VRAHVHMCVCVLQTLCAIWTDISTHVIALSIPMPHMLSSGVTSLKLTDTDVVQLSCKAPCAGSIDGTGIQNSHFIRVADIHMHAWHN